VVVAANLVELLLCEILSSNSSIAEDSGILGNAVYLANGFQTFWKIKVPSSSGSSSPRRVAMLDDWVFCTRMGDKGNKSTGVDKPISVVLICSGQGFVYWLECL
jgi:hypothetical protein